MTDISLKLGAKGLIRLIILLKAAKQTSFKVVLRASMVSYKVMIVASYKVI